MICKNCDVQHERLCACCGIGHGVEAVSLQVKPGAWICWYCRQFWITRRLESVALEMAQTILARYIRIFCAENADQIGPARALATTLKNLAPEQNLFGALSLAAQRRILDLLQTQWESFYPPLVKKPLRLERPRGRPSEVRSTLRSLLEMHPEGLSSKQVAKALYGSVDAHACNAAFQALRRLARRDGCVAYKNGRYSYVEAGPCEGQSEDLPAASGQSARRR